MKKETFTEKLIKRTYGISGPLDEYKRREADRIGNQVFIILFYLMIFGNLIPLLLAYKYPQEVALIYPPLILVIALIAAGYVTYQMKKTGITAIDPDMLSEKESKQLYYPGLKAGLFFGLWMFFITPLLSILIGEGQDYFHSLLTIRNGVSSILGSIFFGASIQFLISRRIAKTKKEQDEDYEVPYEITSNFTNQSHFCQYLYYLFPSFWTNYTSFLDYLPFISSFVE